MARPKRRNESHVRLYAHELNCLAYRYLSVAGRAGLIEFRSLFTGAENRIYMSVRELMRRLGVGQWVAERVIAELLDKGWIVLIERGGFSRKTKHASVYALTSEPLTDRNGDVAPKDYMRWRPPEEKSSVLATSTDGTSHQYSEESKSAKNRPVGTSHQYRESDIRHAVGTSDQYTDKLPGSTANPPVEESP